MPNPSPYLDSCRVCGQRPALSFDGLCACERAIVRGHDEAHEQSLRALMDALRATLVERCVHCLKVVEENAEDPDHEMLVCQSCDAPICWECSMPGGDAGPFCHHNLECPK